MKSDIPHDLQVLAERLRHLRTLLEWRRLQDNERPIERLGRRRPDPSPEEIVSAYGAFIARATEVQKALSQLVSKAKEQHYRWNDEYRKLVLDFAGLDIPERYIKP